jgi:primosomal protein DnaI
VWKPEWLSRLETRDRTKTFDNFSQIQLDEELHPKFYQTIKDFADRFEPGVSRNGFYLSSNDSGVGKTHLLNAVANRLEERNITTAIISVIHFFDWSCNSGLMQTPEIEMIIQSLSSVPVLLLDDIGQELVDEYTLQKLYRIIDLRCTKQLPILYASSLVLPILYYRESEMYKNITIKIISRIEGTGPEMFIVADDYRANRVKNFKFPREDEPNDNDADLESNAKNEKNGVW